MRPWSKLALTGSVLVLGAGVVWIGSPADEPAIPASALQPPVEPAASGDAASSARLDSTSPDAPPTAARRTLVPTPEVLTAPPGIGDHPFAFAVDVDVFDARGLPVAGQTIRVAPIGVDWHQVQNETDHDGRGSLRFAARRASLLVAFSVGNAEGCQVVLLHAGTVRRVVLGTGSARRNKEWTVRRLRRDTGGPVAHLGPLHPFSWFGEHARLRRGATPPTPEASATSIVTAEVLRQHLQTNRWQFDLQAARGTTRLVMIDGTSSGTETKPIVYVSQKVFQDAGSDPTTMAQVDLQQEILSQTWVAYRRPPPPPSIPALRATIRGADGVPLANEQVAWRLGPDQGWRSATTGKGGTFELPAGADGTVQLRAGGGAHGFAEHSCTLVKGQTAQVDLWLWRGRVVRGVAVDAAGTPLGDHVVEWLGVDFAERGTCTTGGDGCFELPNRTVPGRLVLLGKGADAPLAVSAIVHPDGPDVLLQAEPATGTLALQALLPPGCAAFPVRAFVWDAVTGLGRRLALDGDGRMRFENLRAGTYRVVVHADAFGPIDLGGYWVDGSACRDLGSVTWPAPGHATFERGEGGDEVSRVEELHRVGADFDVRIDGFTADTTRLSLGAGTYLWSWRDGDHVAQSQTFAVASGVATVLRR